MKRRTFTCIDAHTCGNPVRLICEGGPELEGETMLDRQQHFIAEFDWVRTSLMFEPRGHAMMSGSILYPSKRDDCDIGVLFVETSGCLPMCGHGTIGTVTIAIEHGLVQPRVPGRLELETPAGKVSVSYVEEGGKVRSVRLTNVPSFLHSSGLEIECPELGGSLLFDIAYGGNFYAIVEPQEIYRDLTQLGAADIVRLSPLVRERINRKYTFIHPDDDRLSHMRHVLWAGEPQQASSDARNAVFYGDAAIDRSPVAPAPHRVWPNWPLEVHFRSVTRLCMKVTSEASSPDGSRLRHGWGITLRSCRASRAGRGFTGAIRLRLTPMTIRSGLDLLLPDAPVHT